MRVLILHDYGRPVGGAERMSLTLRDNLRRRGHAAEFLGSTAEPVKNLPILADRTFPGSVRLQPVLQAFNPAAPQAVRKAIREFRPDVVHVRMYMTQFSPLILKELRGVPALHHVVNYNLICPINTKTLPDGSPCHHPPGTVCRRTGCMSALGVARWKAQDLVNDLTAFDRIVCNSHWTRRRLEAEGIAVSGVVHNGVAVTEPRPPLKPDAVPTIAFAGRLIAKKGAHVLLDALARVRRELPDARLLIAGDGEMRPQLERRAREVGGVEFLGHLTPEAMWEAFSGAWVQAAPSTWEEPFGLVAAEAMMRATAAITTDSGGLAEQVEPGVTGHTTPAGDVRALADGPAGRAAGPGACRGAGPGRPGAGADAVHRGAGGRELRGDLPRHARLGPVSQPAVSPATSRDR